MESPVREKTEKVSADSEIFSKLLDALKIYENSRRIISTTSLVLLLLIPILYLLSSNSTSAFVSLVLPIFFIIVLITVVSSHLKHFKEIVTEATNQREDIGYSTWQGFHLYDYWMGKQSGAEFPEGFRYNVYLHIVETPKPVLNYLEGKVDRIIECEKYR